MNRVEYWGTLNQIKETSVDESCFPLHNSSMNLIPALYYRSAKEDRLSILAKGVYYNIKKLIIINKKDNLYTAQ